MKTLKKLILLAFCVSIMLPFEVAAKTDSEYLRELNPSISTNKVELEIPNKTTKYIYLYTDKDVYDIDGASLGVAHNGIVDVEWGEYKDGRIPICLKAERPGKDTIYFHISGDNTDEKGYTTSIWKTEIKVTVKKAKNIVGFWDIDDVDTIKCTLSAKNQDVYLYDFYEKKFTCSTNNKNIKVSKEGKLTIKKNFCGTAIITVTLKKDKFSGTGKKEKEITLVVQPSRVKIGEPSSPKKETIATKIKLVPGATGYQVFIGKSLGDSGDLKWKSKENTKVFINKNQVKNGQIRLHNKKGGKKHIVSGKWYHLKVRAYKTVKGKKIFGEWSDEWAIRVK